MALRAAMGCHQPGPDAPVGASGCARHCQLEEDHATKSYEADLARRAEIEATTGKKLRGRQPTPGGRRRKKRRWANVTDPDSRLVRTADGFVQGYNAPTAVTLGQVVVVAQVTTQSHDQDHFEPMITAVQSNLAAAEVAEPIGSVLADAGYWSHHNAELSMDPMSSSPPPSERT